MAVSRASHGDDFDVAGVVQKTVIYEGLPALVVVHDEDGDWLVGDGVHDPNEDGVCGVFHLAHLVQRDTTLVEAFRIPAGFAATRESAHAPWIISPWSYSD